MKKELDSEPIVEEDLANCRRCSQIIIAMSTAQKCPNDEHLFCAACALIEHGTCPQCRAPLQPAE